MENTDFTQTLDSVDRIVRSSEFAVLIRDWGFATITVAVREIQQSIRDAHVTNENLSNDDYVGKVSAWLSEHGNCGYVPVFNLTGTIIHTNLGRAILDADLLDRAFSRLQGPISLEYDLRTGKRGQRESIIEERLCRLTNSESAVVVNNNAAALLLLLNTLALNKKVLVSRGELIEIGGSFRLPELIARAGCHLVEVGTTNRTRVSDYRRAITTGTALLLKVHKSNYAIKGFTQEATEQELVDLSRSAGIPFAVDLGSGALINTERYGLPREQRPQSSLKWGCDVVTFSGDKLFGGPQAGIVVGNSSICKNMNSNPLKRALRLDKVALTLLDETLKAYEDPQTFETHVKLYRDLQVSERILRHRASSVQKLLLKQLPDFQVSTEPVQSQVGSGAQPDSFLPSIAVVLTHTSGAVMQKLEHSLRNLHTPIIGRKHRKKLYLDMRGAEPLDSLLNELEQLSC
ncbi:MAG: L-seryl-tRNA(Sec) selenium transferase [Gammaproteobacteria bacterium]|nr:L-seryl-tRNA(Sec) selenium transferase [Gammaproteobacteria bacterium]MDE0251801.1 L-seryl-tRNA(Sec) selenium transferase [Gammaproteobacteria bacterium]MDE0403190.1 L-seryl-tRNA(Sec) selenium transferase [Gammaproteobacteria bacterium]